MAWSPGASRGGLLTANGSTLAIRGGAGNPAADGTGYVRSTDAVNTSGSIVQQGNYVRFTGLSGPLNATFAATNLGDSTQRLKIAGFQILSNDPNPAPTAAAEAVLRNVRRVGCQSEHLDAFIIFLLEMSGGKYHENG